MNRTLYVFEFADEVEAFLSTRPADVLRAKDAAVLAILPEAQAALPALDLNILFAHALRQPKKFVSISLISLFQ